jgi:hypothetical protein
MKTEDINKMARALKQVQETFNDTRPGTKQNQKDFDKAARMAKPKDKVSLKPMPASLAQKMKNEELKGGQHKLDHDKDGDIDAKDFAHMRKKKKSGKEEVTMTAKVDSEKGATEEQKEAKIDEISMDKAISTYAARKSQAQGAAHQGSMDYAKKQMAKARKTKSYIDKRESVEEATMDTAAGRKKASAEADAHHKVMVKKWGANHPATKDAANAAKVMKQKAMEDTEWPIYNRIMENRATHYKGATEAEKIDSKDSPGGKKMRQDIAVDASGKVSNYDDLGHDDASKAGRITKTSPARNGDNKAGDKNVMNAPEDVTKKAGMKA